MKNNIIKDIRYYFSDQPNENGNSLPSGEYFNRIIGAKYSKYGTIISRKLNELEFVSGEYDHIYINYSICIEENKIIVSTRKPEKWIQYIDYGIKLNNLEKLNDKEKINFLINTTFMSLFELYKNNNEKMVILNNVKQQAEKEGDLLKIKYKTKETKKWSINIFYQICPNGINETKCIIEYKDCNNKGFTKEINFKFYEYVYAIMDNITVKDGYIIISPKKSFKASSYINDLGNYEIPIKIKIE
jgi:hypothetical protein